MSYRWNREITQNELEQNITLYFIFAQLFCLSFEIFFPNNINSTSWNKNIF